MILAIDTTSEFGSLALVDAGGVVGEMPMHSPEGFSHVLYGYLTSFLDVRRLTLAELLVSPRPPDRVRSQEFASAWLP